MGEGAEKTLPEWMPCWTWRTGPLARANWQKDEMNSFHCRYVSSGQVITWGCPIRLLCSHLGQSTSLCVSQPVDSSSWGEFSVHDNCCWLYWSRVYKCFNSPFLNGGVLGFLICKYITSDDWMNFLFFFLGPFHLLWATCWRWINLLIEWWVRANIMVCQYDLHTNKCCEVGLLRMV